MKTKFFLFAGLLTVYLTSCSEMDEFADNKGCVVDGKYINIEVTDEFAQASTRANYSGFPATEFEEGDAIGVYAFNGSAYVNSNVKFTCQADGTWTPSSTVVYNPDYTYYAYFPWRASIAYSPTTSGAIDAVDTKFASFITDDSNNFWQANQSTKAGFTYSNLMIAKGVVTGLHTIKFTLQHKRGLALFTGEPADVTFTGNIPYILGATGQFLMKPNVSTSFTDDKGTYSLQAYAGRYVSHYIKGAVDLSMVDNAGDDRASRTTANCYLVHEAGKYKLPLVYGNAIKDGEVNEVAYYPGKNFSVEGGLNRFVNHNGDGITGPWVTKNSSGVDAGMGLTAASAELLWQDVQGLITAVSIDGDFLKFTVGTFNPGNAVIAVKDGSGNILWSWHIWATTETLTNLTSINTGSHTNLSGASAPYRVAPVNLGWVPTGGSGKQGYCPYYQWGRKDPFIPCNGTTNGNTNKTVYNISGATVTGITNSQTNVAIADNIKNPTTHYYNSSTYGPCNTTYYNMWDAQNTATNNVTSATKKTIYDPCPPGFCVPTGNLYCYMGNGLSNPTSSTSRSDSNWDSTNKGKTWTLNGASIYFPAAGYRIRSSGDLGYMGLYGYYWSATPSSTRNGRGLYVDSSYWIWYDYSRAYGFPVRAVAEE